MASPRVFVSSTCYDLKYIRENLRYFVRMIGYEPILSEDGNVFYDPKEHTHDACIAEVPNCQMFILIIGGRYGGKFKETDFSVTNAEFRKAVELKIPVFTLVEQNVYNEHHVHLKNKKNQEIDCSKISYPSVDSTKIFDFIDEVRLASLNNALVPFKDFGDIESYLKQQWAGMMYSFLNKGNEEARVADTLDMLSTVNDRIEMISRQILESVGSDKSKLTADLYDEMISFECIRDLNFLNLKPKPKDVFNSNSYSNLASNLGKDISIEESEEEYDYSVSVDGEFSSSRYASNDKSFYKMKESLEMVLEKHGYTTQRYLGIES